jgi:hypothetical protein
MYVCMYLSVCMYVLKNPTRRALWRKLRVDVHVYICMYVLERVCMCVYIYIHELYWRRRWPSEQCMVGSIGSSHVCMCLYTHTCDCIYDDFAHEYSFVSEGCNSDSALHVQVVYICMYVFMYVYVYICIYIYIYIYHRQRD